MAADNCQKEFKESEMQNGPTAASASCVNAKLEPLFLKLERQRAHTLSVLSDWPLERLRFRPAENAWSALEVLDHLVRTERAMCDAAEKNLPWQKEVPLFDRAKLLALLCMFRFPVKVKVPTAVATILPGNLLSLSEITEHWERERQRWQKLLRSPVCTRTEVAAVQHPVTGWIDVRGALFFLSVHLKHHAFQFKRLAEEAMDSR